MHILIVDDSKAMRMIVRRTLRNAGFGDWTVDEAVSGADALPKIRDTKYDLVLSDWNMPEMNGIDLLIAIRGEGNQTTFGFVTSENTPEVLEEATNAGASFLVTKPFNVKTFQETLGSVVG